MSTWLKEKRSVIGGAIAAFVAILQLFVVAPMNQRFDDLRDYMGQRCDAQDRRFDAQNERLGRLEEAIRNFDRRVSRNEGRIEIIREQIETVDAP